MNIPILIIFVIGIVFGASAAPNGGALIEKANALYQEKKYDEAIAAYSKAIAEYPENSQILMFRGLTKSMKGEWKGCVEDLNRAIKIDPKNPKLLNTRAFALLHAGDFDLVDKDFKAMDQIKNGEGQKARYGMAKSLLWRGRNGSMSEDTDTVKKALDDYNRVLFLVPPNDIIIYERACVLIDLKDFKQALIDLDKVIEIGGDITKFGDPQMKRAQVRRSLKDEAGAKSDEEEANRRKKMEE